MTTRPHVVKVGGSLLSRPGARTELAAWLRLESTREPNGRRLLVVGGGEPVAWLRRVDRQNPLGDEAAHWAAIGMMDANARVVAAWLPGATMEADWNRLTARVGVPGATVFAAGHFLRRVEPELPGTRLPIGWSVTSDAVAARVAAVLGAPLTLLKSRAFNTPNSIAGWRNLADENVVDAFFPNLVAELPSVRLASIGGDRSDPSSG